MEEPGSCEDGIVLIDTENMRKITSPANHPKRRQLIVQLFLRCNFPGASCNLSLQIVVVFSPTNIQIEYTTPNSCVIAFILFSRHQPIKPETTAEEVIRLQREQNESSRQILAEQRLMVAEQRKAVEAQLRIASALEAIVAAKTPKV